MSIHPKRIRAQTNLVAFFKGLHERDPSFFKMYEKYGWYREGIVNITKTGKSGAEEIVNIMNSLRNNVPETLCGEKVITVRDYDRQVELDKVAGKESELLLPKSNVLQFVLVDGTHITARPSGTEPKIKYYFGLKADSKDAAEKKLKDSMETFTKFVDTL